MAEHWFRHLLRFYPASFRREFGGPMIELFNKIRTDADLGTWRGRARFTGVVLCDFIVTASRAWMVVITRARPTETTNKGQARMAGPIRARLSIRSQDYRQTARFHGSDRDDPISRHRRQHGHFYARQRDRPAPVAHRRSIRGRRHLCRRSGWKQLHRVFLSRFHGLPRP